MVIIFFSKVENSICPYFDQLLTFNVCMHKWSMSTYNRKAKQHSVVCVLVMGIPIGIIIISPLTGFLWSYSANDQKMKLCMPLRLAKGHLIVHNAFWGNSDTPTPRSAAPGHIPLLASCYVLCNAPPPHDSVWFLGALSWVPVNSYIIIFLVYIVTPHWPVLIHVGFNFIC